MLCTEVCAALDSPSSGCSGLFALPSKLNSPFAIVCSWRPHRSRLNTFKGRQLLGKVPDHLKGMLEDACGWSSRIWLLPLLVVTFIGSGLFGPLTSEPTFGRATFDCVTCATSNALLMPFGRLVPPKRLKPGFLKASWQGFYSAFWDPEPCTLTLRYLSRSRGCADPQLSYFQLSTLHQANLFKNNYCIPVAKHVQTGQLPLNETFCSKLGSLVPSLWFPRNPRGTKRAAVAKLSPGHTWRSAPRGQSRPKEASPFRAGVGTWATKWEKRR